MRRWVVAVVLGCGTSSSLQDGGAPSDAIADVWSSPFADATASDGPQWPPCNDTAVSPVLAVCQVSPGSVTLDDANVYWVNAGHGICSGGGHKLPPTCVPAGDGALMKCAKSGCDGKPTTLVADLFPTPLVVVGSTGLIYQNGSIASCDLVAGCAAPTALLAQTIALGFVSDGASLFWVDNHGDTYQCALPGCSAAVLVTAAPALRDVVAMTVDDANVYWILGDYTVNPDGGALFDEIVACPKTGCTTPTHVVTSPVYLGVNRGALGSDATTIYFGGWQSGLWSCPKTGCSAATLVTNPSSYTESIETDDGNVYWFAYGSPQHPHDLVTCSTSGACTPKTILSDAVSFAIDETSLFWTSPRTNDDGIVAAMPK